MTEQKLGLENGDSEAKPSGAADALGPGPNGAVEATTHVADAADAGDHNGLNGVPVAE